MRRENKTEGGYADGGQKRQGRSEPRVQGHRVHQAVQGQGKTGRAVQRHRRHELHRGRRDDSDAGQRHLRGPRERHSVHDRGQAGGADRAPVHDQPEHAIAVPAVHSAGVPAAGGQ